MNSPKRTHTLIVEPLTAEGIHPFHWKEDPPIQHEGPTLYPDWGGPEPPAFLSEFRRQMTERQKSYPHDPYEPWPF